MLAGAAAPELAVGLLAGQPPPPGLLAARARVDAFLLSRLAPTTQARYRGALAAFGGWLAARRLRWAVLGHSDRDALVAIYALEQLEADEEGLPYQSIADLIAAIQRLDPYVRFKLSWKVLEAKRADYPVVQALPLPAEAAWAAVAVCLAAG
eukprot:9706327-Lingulodinium_polyedra.AAC.1